MCRTLLTIALASLALAGVTRGQSADTASAQRELAELKAILPAAPEFDQWLAKTGELPPDYDALPTSPWPQDIFTTMVEGKPHRVTREQWPARRAEMRKLLETWLVGHAPPAPGNVRAVIEAKMRADDEMVAPGLKKAGTEFNSDGGEIWQVRLEFGPDHAAKLHCWLFVPANLKKPAPVFLVDNFKYARFAADALKKGTFAVCVYNAPDPIYVEFMPPYVKDRLDESDRFKDLFGKFDWCEFYRRGWSASRAVDWLSTLDFIDAKRIYIGGHSRSAKQSMVGAAFDDRITGVIASSPGSGGSLLYRYCDQYYYGECAELLTRRFPLWVSPKVRFFAGRENKLPADMHFEYALLAPRPVLMSTAINDDVENSWSIERTYDLVHPVWEFLGTPGNLAVRYRLGPHAPDDATYQAHSEFLEAAAAEKPIDALFPYQPIHVWNPRKWQADNPADLEIANVPKSIPAAMEWPARRDAIRRNIQWLLGDGPAYAPIKPDFSAGESDEEAKRLLRPKDDHARITFGDQIRGNLYRPASGNGKSPAIVFLAPLQTCTGYVPGYREGEIPYPKWVKQGYAVLAFDPIATGGRQEERRTFYDRNPHWSLMGKMTLDARHAIDALMDDPTIDSRRIYLVGFGMGGMVATFTAALDDRVAGTVCVCGFTPFRTDTDASPTGGIRRWFELYGWLPRLAPFIGHESTMPIDFDEILAAAVPHPMRVIAPKYDWHANNSDVDQAVDRARQVYQLVGAADAMAIDHPDRPCEFDDDMQALVGWK